MAGFSVIRRGVVDSHNSTADVAVLKEAAPNPMMAPYNAKGDGVTDDTAALAKFLAAGLTYGEIPTPPGAAYPISSSLTLPLNMSLALHPTATIKATAGMSSMLVTPTNSGAQGRTIQGGIFECNQLANTGLTISWITHGYKLIDNKVRNAAQHSVIIGDPGVGSVGDGAKIRGLKIDRDSANAVPAGFYGLWIANTSDCEIIDAEIVGAETSVRNDTGDNRFISVHGWGYSGKVPITCFDDNAAGEWIGCVADTPSSFGFRLRQQNSRILGGRTYINSAYGVDNTVVGVEIDTASSFHGVIGHHFQGSDVSHRLAADFGGAGGPGSPNANITTYGHQRTNCVISNFDQIPNGLRGPTFGGGNPGAGQNKVSMPNSFSGAMAVINGTNLQGYTGNFSGQSLNLDPATGNIQPGNKAGGTAALGAHIYSGSGAPTSPGNVNPTAGDVYFRTDTPSTANQRMYVCTTGGASPVWSGIA